MRLALAPKMLNSISFASSLPPRRLRRRRRWVIASLGLLLAAGALGQRPDLNKASLSLAADRSAYEAGTAVRILGVATVQDKWHVQSNTPTFDYLIPTSLSFELPEGWPQPRIEYPAHSLWMAEFEEEPLAVYEGDVRIFASLELPAGIADGSHTILATLRYQACDDRQCLPPTTASSQIVLTIAADGEPINSELFEPESPAASGAKAGGTGVGLVGILLFGLLGGLILNAMPCVLPVLSLKLLGLVHTAAEGRRATTIGALATASGIIVSFLLLALAAVVAQNAGYLVGWGVQFQNPAFVTFLAIVVVLFCLNLWGLFEIPLPRRLAMRAEGAQAGGGIAGHFATGLFATLMATPCSAPFLGTAVGFALGQSGAYVFAIFTAVGIGMALPYLMIAAAPGTMSWLPKPGEWMLTLKAVMGFLLAGAAVWLLYVLAAQVPSEVLAFIEIGILILALFVWLSKHAQPSGAARRLALVGVAASIVGTMWLSLETDAITASSSTANRLIDWTDFNRSEAEALAREGRFVFVDVTADWCFTCKANERLVLETTQIAEAFEKHGVIAMRADWTNRNDEIARYLADYGRYAVPFYLLYRPNAEPHLFGELLRKKEIIAALEEPATRRAALGLD